MKYYISNPRTKNATGSDLATVLSGPERVMYHSNADMGENSLSAKNASSETTATASKGKPCRLWNSRWLYMESQRLKNI